MRGRSVTAALAVVLTILPALNAICDLGCTFGGAPTRPAHTSAKGDAVEAPAAPCPLHAATPQSTPVPDNRSSAPRGCGHDHVSMRAVELGAAFQLAGTHDVSALPAAVIVDGLQAGLTRDIGDAALGREPALRHESSVAHVVVLRL